MILARIGSTTGGHILCIVLQVYYWVIIARLIVSWLPQIPDAFKPVYRVLFTLTEPLLRMARPLIPPVRTGGMALDLSPLLVFVLLIVLTRILGC